MTFNIALLNFSWFNAFHYLACLLWISWSWISDKVFHTFMYRNSLCRSITFWYRRIDT